MQSIKNNGLNWVHSLASWGNDWWWWKWNKLYSDFFSNCRWNAPNKTVLMSYEWRKVGEWVGFPAGLSKRERWTQGWTGRDEREGREETHTKRGKAKQKQELFLLHLSLLRDFFYHTVSVSKWMSTRRSKRMAHSPPPHDNQSVTEEVLSVLWFLFVDENLMQCFSEFSMTCGLVKV